MQTIVNRKVTNTKWTDDLKENEPEVHFSFRAEFANMRLHMIAFLQENTLLYDNQQKRQMRLNKHFPLKQPRVGPDLDPNCFETLSTDGSNR